MGRRPPVGERIVASRLVEKHRALVRGVALLAAAAAGGACAQGGELEDLSVEELSNINITSVSRHEERLADAPASVFVITAADIRRSGATSLPEVLRLAPNLQVARVSASGYAISARGFNNSSANKLLVLIDGRSVYSPLFSGVFWDVQDVLLEDVERIEVISGPAGTLWGVNAVNGVINVITRSSQFSQGSLFAAGAGNQEKSAAARYGGTLGADGNYRVYGKYFDRANTQTANGMDKSDGWHKNLAGFRADWDHPADQVMLEGKAYGGDEGQPLPGTISVAGVFLPLDTIRLSGANLNGHWTHALDDGASLNLQAYYDRTQRSVPPTFNELLDIFDVQFQHSLHPGGRHTLAWGAEYRLGVDRVDNSRIVAFLPADVNQKWASLFAQDEIALSKDLRLTLGARLERNDYTGNEVLPTARLAWKQAQESLLWAAASRTVRAPSRLDRDTFVPTFGPFARPGGLPFLLAGGPTVISETADVYELGYRSQPTQRLSYSVTAFHARYDHVRTQEILPSATFPFFFASIANNMKAMTTGVELWGAWQASPAWRLSAGMTALHEKRGLLPGSNDQASVDAAGLDPGSSWNLRSSWDLSDRREFDLILRHVGQLASPAVPSYTAIDLRYAWKVRQDMELSVTGQNLFLGPHAEFTDPLTRSELGAAVFFKAVSRF